MVEADSIYSKSLFLSIFSQENRRIKFILSSNKQQRRIRTSRRRNQFRLPVSFHFQFEKSWAHWLDSERLKDSCQGTWQRSHRGSLVENGGESKREKSRRRGVERGNEGIRSKWSRLERSFTKLLLKEFLSYWSHF